MYAWTHPRADAREVPAPYGRDVRSAVRRLRGVDVRAWDALLAITFSVIAVLALVVVDPDPPQRGADALAFLLALTATGALAWRTRAPVPVLLVSTVATVALTIRGHVEASTPFAILISFYTVAASNGRRSRLLATAVLVGAFVLLFAFNDRSGFSQSDVAANVIVFCGAWVAGERARAKRDRIALLEERAAQVVREQDERQRRAVADERLRIAQELHDVVAHAMSVITVQAGVGAHVIDTNPEEARKALATIEATGRTALQELRLMVGVLRQDGDARGLRAPAPSRHAEIEQLVASFRDAGVEVELVWRGEPKVDIPASVYLNGYRILQEALTNVLKHAGRARATVTIHVDHGAADIEVVDDGRGAASSLDGHQPGFGLLGMQERAAVLGGTVQAAPAPGGGFRVRAHLPFAASGAAGARLESHA